MTPFDPEPVLQTKPSTDAVAALSEASRQLLLPVDVDLHFLALVELGLPSENVVSRMQAYLSARAVAAKPGRDAIGGVE